MPTNPSLNCTEVVSFNLPSEIVDLINEIVESDPDISSRSQFFRGCVLRKLFELPEYCDRALIILCKTQK